MRHYQVSKFLEGEGESWSSVTDIGKVFSGKQLSVDEYITVENIYIEVIAKFINKIKKRFKVKFLMDLRGEDDAEQWLFEIDNPYLKVRGGEYLGRDDILSLCRLSLRDLLGIRLQSDDGDYITFGHDFYLRLGVSSSSDIVLTELMCADLFFKEMDNDPED